jgi:hypothetical protein
MNTIKLGLVLGLSPKPSWPSLSLPPKWDLLFSRMYKSDTVGFGITTQCTLAAGVAGESVHAWCSGGITPLVISFSSSWKWAVTFTRRSLYPREKSFVTHCRDGPHSWSGRCAERGKSVPLKGLQPMCLCECEALATLRHIYLGSWDAFSWTLRTLEVWVWRQCGTPLEGQGSHDSGLVRGHKGPVRPTCIGTVMARPTRIHIHMHILPLKRTGRWS